MAVLSGEGGLLSDGESASGDRTRLRGVPLGEPLTGHTDVVRWGAWANVAGRPVLATGGNDGAVRLWDGLDRTSLGKPLTGHTAWMMWGAWAGVGGRSVLATGGDDRTVRLWGGQGRPSPRELLA